MIVLDDELPEEEDYMKDGYQANGYIYSGQLDLTQPPCPRCSAVVGVASVNGRVWCCTRCGLKYAATPSQG